MNTSSTISSTSSLARRTWTAESTAVLAATCPKSLLTAPAEHAFHAAYALQARTVQHRTITYAITSSLQSTFAYAGWSGRQSIRRTMPSTMSRVNRKGTISGVRSNFPVDIFYKSAFPLQRTLVKGHAQVDVDELGGGFVDENVLQTHEP